MDHRSTLNQVRQIAHPFDDLYALETSPPVWSPIRNAVTCPRPRKWQLCAPRLRSVVKWAFFLTAAFLAFMSCLVWPATPSDMDDSAHISAGGRLPAQQDWIWQDFPKHDGLIRGLRDFRVCDANGTCETKPPYWHRYQGRPHTVGDGYAIVQCTGPRGLRLNESDEDAVWVYAGASTGAVGPAIGSYKASGLDGSVSFDRIGRYQAYGIEQFDSASGVMAKQQGRPEVKWDDVDWGGLQRDCVKENIDRFAAVAGRASNSIQPAKADMVIEKMDPDAPRDDKVGRTKRTAILIRVWTGVVWAADAVVNIRAMIAEAALASGGEYQVFILLHVKDESIAIFSGEGEPEQTIRAHVPPEFHSMTEVWTDAQMRALYSNIAEHAFVGRSPWMAVQWFARSHPEFDFFYQWEFDVRWTGHYLNFFDAVSSFGRKQPRKGIWERAGRLYIPAVHNDFDTDFRARTRAEDPHAVWGPVPVEGVRPRGPRPPMPQEHDWYQWGVGEDADWIGFLPSFNVTMTTWWFRDYLWGYAQGTSTPRRSTLVAHGRVSRRLLDIMSYENSANGHHMDAEMFPQTVCLHHGLKSTSFPHPIFADRHWPSQALQAIFNGGPHGQAGGFPKSTFSKWNEHAWTNLTWYYNSAQAKPVYQNFFGITANNRGGSEWEAVHGRAVIRPMLLHPVKGAKSTYWTVGGWRQTKSGA